MDLEPGHTLLDGSGIAVSPVTTDITGSVRLAPPDIGAKEISICANDASVNELWGTTNPLPIGFNQVRVVLQNQGSNPLTSVTINWKLNGSAQPSYSWTGSLAPRQNTVVTIGSFVSTAATNYAVQSWVSNPNGQSDCNHYNDTCSKSDYATPLCGVYTIGGINPDYIDFTAAAFALNNAGISCPVTFKVRAGAYDEQVKLYEVLGSSAINTITFEPDSQVNDGATRYTIPASLRSGLQALYLFDGNASDSSGNGLNGVANGGTYVRDRYGNSGGAIDLRGTSYVSAPVNISERSLTVSMYFRTTQYYSGLFSATYDDLGAGGEDRRIQFYER
ncbi:MAG: hypothetical protein ACKOKF_11695, partial [Bacteroidota bacterium]